MKMKFACCMALILGLLASPAAATVVEIFFIPNDYTIDLNAGETTADIGIWADIGPVGAIGWGLDLDITPALATFGPADVVVTAPWAPAFAPDGDGLAGLSVPPQTCILDFVQLATVTVTATGVPGDAALSVSFTPDDLTEGFLDCEGNFADVIVNPGMLHVVPEPAALVLLGLGGLALIRRRR